MLSSTLNKVDGHPVGAHPKVTDLILGMTNLRPRSYKSPPSWSIDEVLNLFISWGNNSTLQWDCLGKKAAMLCALTAGSRCCELTYLDVNHMKKGRDEISFELTKHKKAKRKSVLPGKLIFPTYKRNLDLCPVDTIEWYIIKTAGLRDSILNPDSPDPLFRAISKPHAGVTPQTISRWITSIISETEGQSISSKSIGHSVRGKMASKLAYSGFSFAQIMGAVEWSSQSVFTDFYCPKTVNAELGRAVLNLSGDKK